jgi:hypothetical protein
VKKICVRSGIDCIVLDDTELSGTVRRRGSKEFTGAKQGYAVAIEISVTLFQCV